MTTVIRGPRPLEVEAWLERRRRLGLDRRDEVWEGVLVVPPDPHSDHGQVQGSLYAVLSRVAEARGLRPLLTFNLGVLDDFRIPDAGLVRREQRGVWFDSALLVVEVLSPDDASLEKVPFYAGRGVQELLLLDPRDRSVRVLELQAGGGDVDRSEVLGLSVAELVAAVEWPE